MANAYAATAKTNSRIAAKKVGASDRATLEKIASQTGGKINTGKGGERVEYQVRGMKGGKPYKATRYAYNEDDINTGAPVATDVYAEDAGKDRGTLTKEAGASALAPEDPGIEPTSPQSTGMVAYEQAQKNLAAGGLQGGALTMAQDSLAKSYGKSKYEVAHETLKGGVAPADGGAAMSQVYSATPYEPDQAKVDAIFSEDPVINTLMTQAYDLLQPDVQKTSLLQDYKKLYKESGLKDLNEELIDAETIIDGTEDDIRNEIQTAGGFGTESQVQAMTLARNKGLLKRYNQLFAMKQSAEQNLQTMLTISQQDRQMAMQRSQNQLNTLFQLANFRQQAQNAYKETARWALTTMGADNLYNSMKGDPVQVARYEKMMGLPAGGLSTAAAQAATDRATQAYMQSLQIQKAEQDVGIGVPETASGQSPADQLQFLIDTSAKARELSGGAGDSPALNWISRNVFGATEKDRLATQVRTLASNMLTLATDPNIKKFFGPQMSDADVKQMLAAGSTLNVDEMNKADLEAELDRLDTIFSKLQGAATGMTVYDPSGGTWVKEP